MGLSGRVPNRVDAATKSDLLELLDQALAAGWTWRRACRRLDLPERRANRWLRRRDAGRLADATPGGGPVHAILEQEVQAILAVFEQWAEVDRSHRKLAHRGSYLGRFWCSPSTVRRVLLLGDKHFRPRPQPGRSTTSPLPDWAGLVPNSIWIYDSTHFTRCGMTVLIIEDLISHHQNRVAASARDHRPAGPARRARHHPARLQLGQAPPGHRLCHPRRRTRGPR